MKTKIVLWVFGVIAFLPVFSAPENAPWAPFEYERQASADELTKEQGIKLIEEFNKAIESGVQQKIQDAAKQVRSNQYAMKLIKNMPFLNQQLDNVLPLNVGGKIAEGRSLIEPTSPKTPAQHLRLEGADALEAPPPGAPKGPNEFTFDEVFGTGQNASADAKPPEGPSLKPASGDVQPPSQPMADGVPDGHITKIGPITPGQVQPPSQPLADGSRVGFETTPGPAMSSQVQPPSQPIADGVPAGRITKTGPAYSPEYEAWHAASMEENLKKIKIPPKPKNLDLDTQIYEQQYRALDLESRMHYDPNKPVMTDAQKAELAKRNIPQETYKPYATGDKPRVDAESSWSNINRSANYDAEVVLQDAAKFSKNPQTSKLVDSKNAYVHPDSVRVKSFEVALKQAAFDFQQGVATGKQVQMLRQNNDAINLMAKRGEIENVTYQKVQQDYAEFVEARARAAAQDAGLEFNPQKRGPVTDPDDIFKPGTDSDNILGRPDRRPVTFDQIAEARTNFNRRMNTDLNTKNIDYAKKFDVDFHADPRGIPPEEFARIADLNTAGYRDPDAALAEALIRRGEPLSTDQSRKFADEMLDMGNRTRTQVDQYRDAAIEARKTDPDVKKFSTKNIDGTMEQKMQLQAKYNDKLNDASNRLADQYGVRRPDVSNQANSGANRSTKPDGNLNEVGMARRNLIQSSISNANQDYLTGEAMRGYAEVNAGASGRAATPEMRQQLLDNAADFGVRLSLAEQGRLIDDVRINYGDETAQALTKQMRIRNTTVPDTPGGGGKAPTAPDAPGKGAKALKVVGDTMVALDILNTGQDFIDWYDGKKSGGQVALDTVDRFTGGPISTGRMVYQRSGNLVDAVDKNVYSYNQAHTAWVNQTGVALGKHVSRDERKQIIDQLNTGDRSLLDQKIAQLKSKGIDIKLPDEGKIRAQILGNMWDMVDFNSPSEQAGRVKDVFVGMGTQVYRAGKFVKDGVVGLGEINYGLGKSVLTDGRVAEEFYEQQKDNLSLDNLSAGWDLPSTVRESNRTLMRQGITQQSQKEDLYATLIIKGATEQEAVEALIALYGDGKKNPGGDLSKLRNLRDRLNKKYDTQSSHSQVLTYAEDAAAWDKLRSGIDWQWGKERVWQDEEDENPFADGKSDQYQRIMDERKNQRNASRDSRLNNDLQRHASTNASNYGLASLDKELDAIYETMSGPPECWNSSDCPSGYHCRNSQCVPYDCGNNSDCPEGFACRNGQCVELRPGKAPEGCTNNSDCPEGYACRSGECVELRPDKVPGSCGKNSDCPEGYACRSGQCMELRPDKIPGGCGKNSDCPEGYACRSGQCVELRPDKVPGSCGKNSDCPEGYACRSGQCVELRPDKVPGSCGKNSDCPEGYACRSGQCVKLRSDPAPPTAYYYIIKEFSSYLNRYSKCTSTQYRVLGPMTDSQFSKELSMRQTNAKTKVTAWQSYPKYGESYPYSMTISQAEKHDTMPTAPKGGVNCTNCSQGQHIGLDPGKRFCH